MKVATLVCVVSLFGCAHSSTTQVSQSQSVDREKIRAVVKSHALEVQDCFRQALKKQPDQSGKFVIEWTIGAGGKVLDAKVKSTTLLSSEVATCTIQKLKTWTFPKTPENEVADISYPFTFDSSQEKQ